MQHTDIDSIKATQLYLQNITQALHAFLLHSLWILRPQILVNNKRTYTKQYAEHTVFQQVLLFVTNIRC